MTLVATIGDVLTLVHFLQVLRLPIHSTSKLLWNNISATYSSTDPINHQWMKYIKIDMHLIQEKKSCSTWGLIVHHIYLRNNSLISWQNWLYDLILLCITWNLMSTIRCWVWGGTLWVEMEMSVPQHLLIKMVIMLKMESQFFML